MYELVALELGALDEGLPALGAHVDPRAVRVQVLPHRAAIGMGVTSREIVQGKRIKMGHRLRDPASWMPLAADESSCNLLPTFLTINAVSFVSRLTLKLSKFLFFYSDSSA